MEVPNHGDQSGNTEEKVQYRILHQDNFAVEKVFTNSSQACIFLGRVKNLERIQQKDVAYVKDKIVLLK